jgi:surfeit locus 1 family protein
VTSGYRRFLVPGVSTLIMLLALLGLGTWQVYRLQWKERILAQIAAAEAAPAVPLGQDPAPYMKVSVTGRFRFDQAAAFGAEVRDTQTGPTMGFYQIVPLDREGASAILVNRGWLPQKREFPLNHPTGPVTVTGYVRPRETQSWFSVADDAPARQFYTLDPQAIGSALDVLGLAPFTLVAMGPSSVGAYPAPAQHLPRPPNNHLSYIITWYGLAASLLVIFSVWVRKALRS